MRPSGFYVPDRMDNHTTLGCASFYDELLIQSLVQDAALQVRHKGLNATTVEQYRVAVRHAQQGAAPLPPITVGRVDGVISQIAGTQHRIDAKLVIGADGVASRVATLAELPGRRSANHRFGCFAYYRGTSTPNGEPYSVWIRDGSIGYHLKNDGEVSVLAAILTKDQLPAFAADPRGTLERTFTGVADGPDLSAAERVSPVISVKDYPSITRRRLVAPGVALVGDAAQVFDPLWGAGCAWAFQSAAWLADAVADALGADDSVALDAATRHYQRQHRRATRLHQWHAVDFSQRTNLRSLERLVMAGGAHDHRVARTFWEFHSRTAPAQSLFMPAVLARAAVAVGAHAVTGWRDLLPAVGERRRHATQSLVDGDQWGEPEITLGGTNVKPMR